MTRRRLLVLAVLLVVEAVGFAMLVTESVTGALVVVGGTVASVWVHIVLHECGHLVAALLLRIPVVAVRIAPFTGRRNEVEVVRSPSMPALRARMVLLAAAGPATNLATAAALVAAATGPLLVRLTMYGAALTAVLLGVLNLIPKLGPRTDGTQIYYWLVQPAAMTGALHAVDFQHEVSRLLPTPVPDVVAAFRERCATGLPHTHPGYLADAERLAALAKETDPETAAAIGQTLTIQFGMWYLRSAVLDRTPVAHTEVVEIADLARLSDARTTPGRLALALAHLLDDRPGEARALLADDRLPGAVLVRAVADRYLGHPPTAPGDDFPELAHLVTTVHAADPPPPLSVR